MTAHSLVKADTIAAVLAHVLPADFGKGTPACRDVDPELFWPPSADTSAPAVRAQISEAKAVCRQCPIRRSCQSWAIPREGEGLWGGLTEAERARRRRRRRAKAAKYAGVTQVQLADQPGAVDQDVDEVAVERVLRGGAPGNLNDAERAEVARRMVAAGKSKTAIAKRLHMSGTAVNARVEIPQCQGCGRCSRCIQRRRLAVAS